MLGASYTAMKGYDQFILYVKATKVPAGNLNPMDPNSWMSYDTAVSLSTDALGVGFVFTKEDPFFFLDIDKALKDGEWSENAQNLCGHFPDALIETSMSQTGLHIIGTGQCPPHACKNIPLGLELYTADRYCALTGLSARGDSGAEYSNSLAMLVPILFPEKIARDSSDWTTEYHPDWNGSEDDQTLIDKAMATVSASAAFNGKATFKQLWEGDTTAFGGDKSSADMSLAQHLAFWAGKNCDRILALMEQSGLVREKWTNRDDYLRRTIIRAVAMQEKVYTGGKKKEVLAEPIQEGLEGVRYGAQILAPTQQLEHFKGCVYIADRHQIFTPKGIMLKPDQFRAMYGGFSFVMDSQNDRIIRNAWEAFTESQVLDFPKAISSIFRPTEPPGTIIDIEGTTHVNTYIPIEVKSKKGDATLFYNHMKKLFPDAHDYEVALSYMAACVQYKGVKFQWCLLIQGVEGNGKTLLSECVVQAVGEKHTHYAKAAQLGSNFNSWVENKVFVGVEDIYIPSSRQEIMESLKPMITGKRQSVEKKGVDEVTSEICANFILNSNHKDAVKKSANDRRFCIFYTPQQKVEDLKRDGMAGSYFGDLYEWLEKDGYAIVTNELLTYEIKAKYNPATKCQRAPKTTSTAEVISSSAGVIEQEVIEASESHLVGFVGPWISMHHLDALLLKLRKSMSHVRRQAMLEDMGYIKHPALRDGRASTPVALDGGSKPRLYIKADHPSANPALKGSAVVALYIADQAPSATNGSEAAAVAFAKPV